MRRSKYTAELLGPIVASSHTYTEVIRKLGLKPTGGNHRLISARIRYAGVDTSHFKRYPVNILRARIEAFTPEQLTLLAPSCSSVAALLLALELPQEGRAHAQLSRRLRALDIDTRHFQGRAWNRGHT